MKVSSLLGITSTGEEQGLQEVEEMFEDEDSGAEYPDVKDEDTMVMEEDNWRVLRDCRCS